jgi:hypothetical protein
MAGARPAQKNQSWVRLALPIEWQGVFQAYGSFQCLGGIRGAMPETSACAKNLLEGEVL